MGGVGDEAALQCQHIVEPFEQPLIECSNGRTSPGTPSSSSGLRSRCEREAIARRTRSSGERPRATPTQTRPAASTISRICGNTTLARISCASSSRLCSRLGDPHHPRRAPRVPIAGQRQSRRSSPPRHARVVVEDLSRRLARAVGRRRQRFAGHQTLVRGRHLEVKVVAGIRIAELSARTPARRRSGDRLWPRAQRDLPRDLHAANGRTPASRSRNDVQ